MSVEEVSLYFLGGYPIPYIEGSSLKRMELDCCVCGKAYGKGTKCVQVFSLPIIHILFNDSCSCNEHSYLGKKGFPSLGIEPKSIWTVVWTVVCATPSAPPSATPHLFLLSEPDPSKRTWSSIKSRINVPHLESSRPPWCRAQPWCPPRCPPCRSAGRRARPQVWHISLICAFYSWNADER